MSRFFLSSSHSGQSSLATSIFAKPVDAFAPLASVGRRNLQGELACCARMRLVLAHPQRKEAWNSFQVPRVRDLGILFTTIQTHQATGQRLMAGRGLCVCLCGCTNTATWAARTAHMKKESQRACTQASTTFFFRLT